ncbi:MAG: glycosyl transferase group 1 [Actinotalea sp.]|nr:glycosyl transferase group 1 [Actinotalea sp.]
MTPRASSGRTARTVVHFGNRIGSQGGMASVLEEYSQMGVSGHRLRFVATYDPEVSRVGARLLPRVLAELLLARLRGEVVHVHLSTRGSFVREGLVVRLARLVKLPVVATLHGADVVDYAALQPARVAAVLLAADVVVPLAPETTELLRRRWPGVRVRPMENPVQLPKAPPAPAPEPVALFAGEQCRRKGLDVLLAAWPDVRARVPAARLLVVGPAGDVVVGAGAGIEDKGPLPRQDVLGLLTVARVCVLPSRHEALPMFLLEAMAHARAVVTTPVGGIPGAVEGAGVLVPVGDVRSLADALVDLLDDADRTAALASAGRDRVRSTAAPEVIAAQLADVYSLLRGPRSGWMTR